MGEGKTFEELQAEARPISSKLLWAITAPADWIKRVLEAGKTDYTWYHRQYKRVPTVDKCQVGDQVCIFEATHQMLRDRRMEGNIVDILAARYEECAKNNTQERRYKEDPESVCFEALSKYNKARENHYIKYGELPYYATAVDALMKQKHRMIWERRHGPVGSGRNPDWVPPVIE